MYENRFMFVGLRRLLVPAVSATFLAALCIPSAPAQKFQKKVATPADWEAVAKLPDFTGVWNNISRPIGGITNTSIAIQPINNPPPPKLTPEYEAKRKALQAVAPDDELSSNCLPVGLTEIVAQPYPVEFLLTPGQVTIFYEAYSRIRHIYTDGRPLPKDPDLSFYGTSIGHWEGDTLVVESVGFSPDIEIQPQTPHSDQMKVVERYKLANPDLLDMELTVTDPIALAEPYFTHRQFKRRRDWTISEYVCEQNNRNFVGDNGKSGINLTVPGSSAAKGK
jgi:hypothetical protein